MSRILVLYGTTEGHTAKVARFIADVLRQQGGDVDVVHARTTMTPPEEYEAVVVAASVHAGTYQRTVETWAKAHAAALQARPSAFVSVCLGVLQKEPRVQQEVSAIVDRFCTRTGWIPSFTKTIAGALPYTRYGWLKRRMMQRIVRKAGGDTDVTRDYEYTDWNDLRVFVRGFAASIGLVGTDAAAVARSQRVA